MSEPITRREFVAATLIMGAGVAGASGCTSSADQGADVPTPSSNYGKVEAMGSRILVGYATRTGSTTGVAEAIGAALAERGYAVDVKPMKEHPSVDGYDAVILGSAINGGRWLPEAIDYLTERQDALRALPVSLFCVHAMNCGPDPVKTRKRLAYLDKERELIAPAGEGFFAGQGPTGANSNAITRWLFTTFGGDVEGDGRDWDAIRAWALQVPTQVDN